MSRPVAGSKLTILAIFVFVTLVCSLSCTQEVDPIVPEDTPATSDGAATDPESELVQDLISRAFDDASKFRRQEGTLDDPEHPLRDWSELLWSYREVHPGTEAAAKATQAALSMKGRLGEIEEMYALAGQVDPDSPMWEETQFLLITAWQEQDADPVVSLAEEKIAAASDPESRSALQLLLGKTLLANGQRDEAMLALTSAIDESPRSPSAEEALDIKRVATELAPGQPAQWPEESDTKGNPISLDDFAGRYLLLNYWASW